MVKQGLKEVTDFSEVASAEFFPDWLYHHGAEAARVLGDGRPVSVLEALHSTM